MSEYYFPTEAILDSLKYKETTIRLAKLATSKMNDRDALNIAHRLIQKATLDGISKLHKSLTDDT